MDDYISRQAALDIFDDYNVAVENGQIEAYSRDRKRLCDLPPAQLGTNLAEVGTDCISRQAAIDGINKLMEIHFDRRVVLKKARNVVEQLPPAQPEIIRCRNCKFASGDSRICMKFGHSPIGELDFCAWAERRTNERSD